VICGRDPQKLLETQRWISRGADRVESEAVDLADPADCDALVRRVLERFERVDVLINNAGRSIRRSVEHSLDRQHDFQRTMALNYFGALRVTLGLLPGMVERRAGHVINISSIAVLMGSPRFSGYAASKAALDAWSRCAACEYADLGVDFTTIYMPLVRTPMIAPTSSYARVPALSVEQAAELTLRAIVDRPARIATPLGALVDLAHAVAPHWTRRFGNYLFRGTP
jgi:NAD(P)-dependent dehydrogenase (short-subunit alcohol dehydrogenase family)